MKYLDKKFISDKLKKVDVKVIYNRDVNGKYGFTLNNIYDASFYIQKRWKKYNFSKLMLYVTNDSGLEVCEFATHFILLSDWREKQINSIL